MYRTRLLQRCKTIAFQQTPQTWRWQRLCWNYANIPNRKQTKSRSHATSPRHIFQKTFEYFTRICFQCHGFVWVTCFCEMIDQFFWVVQVQFWAQPVCRSSNKPARKRFERSGRSLLWGHIPTRLTVSKKSRWICVMRITYGNHIWSGMEWCPLSNGNAALTLSCNTLSCNMNQAYLSTQRSTYRMAKQKKWEKTQGQTASSNMSCSYQFQKLHVDPYQRKITRPNWLMFRHLPLSRNWMWLRCIVWAHGGRPLQWNPLTSLSLLMMLCKKNTQRHKNLFL